MTGEMRSQSCRRSRALHSVIHGASKEVAIPGDSCPLPIRRTGTMFFVSQTQRPESKRLNIAALPPDERVWLEERVREYRELLNYLRDH